MSLGDFHGDSTDHDDDDNDNNVSGVDGVKPNWKSEQHRWTSEVRPEDEEVSYAAGEADGYQMLTCRVRNNFYTHYRW